MAMMASTTNGLATSGPASSPSQQMRGPPPLTANSRRDGPHSPCSASTSNALQTCFYFTVFFSNNPPIFHSNRIPANLLGITPSPSSPVCANGSPTEAETSASGGGSGIGAAAASSTLIGDVSSSVNAAPSPSSPCAACQQRRWQAVFSGPVDGRGATTSVGPSPVPVEGFTVGDFRCEAAAVDEVPQQTLQTVAFPTAFGSCGMGGGACPLPRRTLGTRPSPQHRPSSLTTAASSSSNPPPPPENFSSGAPAPTSPLASQQTRRVAAEEEVDREGEAVSRGSSNSEAPTKASTIPTTLGSNPRSSGASSMHKHHSICTTSIQHSRSSQPHQNGTTTLSPDTLPLTTTASTDTTTTAMGMSTNAMNTSLIPARFQPTFPLVTWEDEEEKSSRGPAAEAEGKKQTEVTVAAAAAAPPVSAASAAAPAPTSVALGRAPARARRPRPAVSAAASASAQPNTSAVARPLSPSLARPQLGGKTTTPTAAAAPPPPPPPPAPLPTASPTRPAPPLAAPAPTAAASSTDTAVAVTPPVATPPVISQEGPPWNMRVEEVRSAKGELRYYRVILTVSFAALITSHTGMLHSMQTRNAAAALVLTCPPSGVHYRFLLHHVDVLRSALNRTTEFAIRTVQRFFGLLFSPTQKPKGTQQQVLKGITNLLEMHSEACETYRAVKAELAHALGVLCPLPLLPPATSGWVVPVLLHSSMAAAAARRRGGRTAAAAAAGAGGAAHLAKLSDSAGDSRRPRSGVSAAMSWLSVGSSRSSRSGPSSTPAGAASNDTTGAPQPPLSDILCDATAYICDYSEGFASAFVCGLLSLVDDGVGRRVPHLHVKAVPTTAAGAAAGQAPLQGHSSSSTNGGEDVSLPPTRASSRVGSPTTTTAAGAAGATTREASCALPSLTGIDTTAPDWLSAYGSYFSSVSASANSAGGSAGEESGEAEGWIRLSKPVRTAKAFNLRDRESESDDACLRTHVSASTVSSITPVLSPLTVDVDARSPSARLLRGRTLSTPSTTATTVLHLSGARYPANLHAINANTSVTSVANGSWAAPQTPTTAQLYTISAETSLTSHAATMAMSGTTSPQFTINHTNTNANRSGGEVANMSCLSRPQTSTFVSATTSGAASPLQTFAASPKASTVSPAAAVRPSPSSPSTTPQPKQQQQQQQRQPSGPRSSASTTSPTAAVAGKEDEYVLHRGRMGRVVIFTQDAVLARRLLLVAAFLWNEGAERGEGGVLKSSSSAAGAATSSTTGSAHSPSCRGACDAANAACAFRCEDAQRMYETAVAAAVTSAEFANVPIQWLAEEFSEARLASLCSRFSPENTLLVVVPRQLQCRRVRLRKHVAGTTVLVEQQLGKEARIRSPAFPFCCAITKQTVLLPDPTVTTLLREARSLHLCSRGTVDFAEVFQRMVAWLYWQSAAAVLARRDALVHAATMHATLQATTHVGHGSGEGLSRNGSADLLWPSRSVSAIGSRATTPTMVTPVALLGDFPRVLAGASSTTSASPCTPAMAMERAWTVDASAEESLLPGSRGGASAAWAYTAHSHNINNTSAGGSGGGGGAAPGVSNASAAAAVGGAAASHVTSTLLVSHGLLQPPSAFVTASPTAPTPPQKSSSLRFLNWFKSSPTSGAGTPHSHPILSPTTLSQLSAGDGGQLPRLLAEDEGTMMHH